MKSKEYAKEYRHRKHTSWVITNLQTSFGQGASSIEKQIVTSAIHILYCHGKYAKTIIFRSDEKH